MDMKVLVVRQPWAWLIVNGHKDIENRSWRTRYRGTLLIQASASLPSKGQMEEFRGYSRQRDRRHRRHGAVGRLGNECPEQMALQREGRLEDLSSEAAPLHPDEGSPRAV
jgi:hypothetical protein